MESLIITKGKLHIEHYKTPILFLGTSIAKAFAMLIFGFIIARFISPGDYRFWTLISLAVTYSIFLLVGFLSELNIELPYVYCIGEEDMEKKCRNNTDIFNYLFAHFWISRYC